MRLSIERLRWLVLVAGGLLVIALAVFLEVGHLRSRFNLRDLPRRLGANIERQQNGVVYTQTSHGHLLFRLQASKVVQLKENGHALLNDVEIELYGKDGKTAVDRIRGGEFEWDQKGRSATAAGPVEILIMQPLTAPAAAEGMRAGKQEHGKPLAAPLSNAAHSVAMGQIDVKTSGLTFDGQSGAATTAQRVEFTTVQGSGSAEGATFDSNAGTLVLERAVELNVRRGGENINLRAQHAEFDRDQRACDLRGADAVYRGGAAKAGEAKILFRENGSAARLDGRDGFVLTTATGARIASPSGWLDFNERNQPQKGMLAGGATMDLQQDGRKASGSAPMVSLEFSARGDLRLAHLERGVMLHSEQDTPGGLRTVRDWRSPVADVAFRSVDGRTDIEQVHGTGGVMMTGLTQREGEMAAPSRMSADDVTGTFGPGQQLTELVGVGRATLEQTTASGAQETTSGDRIEARFVAAKQAGAQEGIGAVRSATIDGQVMLTDRQPAAGKETASLMRATCGHAVYDGAGEWLHLTENPRIEEAGLVLTADKVDVSQASGDALARGNVKATWVEDSESSSRNAGTVGLGGNEPAHVIAAQAEMRRATGEATFRGQARLWQGANSVSAPEIVLNRVRQTLVARGNGAAQPVKLVMLSAAHQVRNRNQDSGAPAAPEVVRVRARDLKYSAAERKAVLHGGVVAQAEGATVSSSEAEMTLLPPGNHAGPEGRAAQVDRMTARGDVVITSEGRRGTGEQLVYTSESGEYALTGTSEKPPRLDDPGRGRVTGNALIFNSRDDSVSIEGGSGKTQTETLAPKKRS